MNARKLLSRVVQCLCLSLAAHGSVGCATMPYRFWWVNPNPPVTMPPKVERAEPVRNDSKPTDAVEDSDDRHPSRWRQKLRAKYS